MTTETGDAQTEIRACANCKSLLPGEVVFCPDCGTYQGQPDVDDGSGHTESPAATSPLPTSDVGAGLRTCPHCGAAVSSVAVACTNCFRPLEPAAPLSGPELKRASRGLIWFLMGGGGLIILAWIALEIFDVLNAVHVH